MERIIFHIDVNSAYLSWSAIDLLKANPGSVDIRTIPAIIGGNRKTRHGIVPWQSLCQRKIFTIFILRNRKKSLKKMSDAHHHSPDHDSYSRHSKQFVGFLRSLTSEIEQVGVWMNVTWTILPLLPFLLRKKARPLYPATIFTAIWFYG